METNFNFKSQPATSREQSEKLLALGLKAETADMHWRLQPYYNDEGFDCGLEWSCNMGTFLQDDAHELFLDYIPAWSLHRLVEMMPQSVTSNNRLDYYKVIYNSSVCYQREHYNLYRSCKRDLYEDIISCIEWLIKEGYFNKEYLKNGND